VTETGAVSDASRTFAVTGAGGFIGGRLIRLLLENGHKAVAVVRTDEQAAELEAIGAKVRLADVRNRSELKDAFSQCDGVFHLAALFNHPDKTWDDYRAVNVDGSVNVLAAAKETNVSRVVHCSTVGVATEAEPPPYSEDTPYSPQPDDKYEVTKCEAEQAARKYAAENDLSLAVIRPAQVYGPGDLSKTKFYKLVRKGVIVNPGKTRKHLIFVDDLCRSFLLAMTVPQADGEIFLIAGNESIALSDLVRIVADALKVGDPKIKLPAWPVTFACSAVERISNLVGIKPPVHKRSMDFFTRSVECETDKARRILGFQSEISVPDGIQRTAEWYRAEGVI
jgi:nucleoside-diphosphate-sugar epimerase